jgi:Fe-S cluster biogenesis protein NfuA
MSAAATVVAPPRALDAVEAGQRVEDLLDRLSTTGDQEVCAAAEELVRVLMDFYGAGLARIVGRLGTPADRGTGDGPLAALLDDELVSSLLALHDLHPEDIGTRITRALDSVRDPVEVVGFDEETGILRLRSSAEAGDGGGCGCPSTGAATQRSVEDALACFVPEVEQVVMEPVTIDREPPLLQIATRPPAGTAGAGATVAATAP